MMLWLCVALLLWSSWAAGGGATNVVTVCAAGTARNDLVELLRRAKLLGPAPTTWYCDFTTLSAAAKNIQAGTSVLTVSANAGAPPLDLSAHGAHGDALARLARAGSRLYVEFAQFSAARPAATSSHERVVVPPHSSLKSLDALTLLNPHVVNYTSLGADRSSSTTDPTAVVDLYLATVAGYDAAANLDNTTLHPLLVQYNRSELMVASAALSRLVSSRFAPHQKWLAVVRHIAAFLTRGMNATEIDKIDWADTVRPTLARADPLRPNRGSEADAFFRGVDWYFLGGQFPDVELGFDVGFQRQVSPSDSPPFLLPDNYPRPGSVDGRMGLFEGYQKTIEEGGRQLISPNLRNDCISESAMAIAFRHSTRLRSTTTPAPPPAAVLRLLAPGTTNYGQVARNMLNFLWVHAGFVQQWLPGLGVMGSSAGGDPWGDTSGLFAWSSTDAAIKEYYTDDNARSLLAGLAARSRLGSSSWDSQIAGAILANLRMAGVHGFSQSSAPFSAVGAWEMQRAADRSAEAKVYSPHYQSWIWAVFLKGYAISGHAPLLAAAKSALSKMMEHYPAYWQATSNGITMQRARMLLPLAWLCRVEDTDVHRGWLAQVASGLLARQNASTGAIQEEISAAGWGSSARVPSNADYGTFEAPLNQDNTDPVSDLLYTSNFAFVGLHEAASLPRPDAAHVDAADKLAGLLVRAQVTSEAHPEFDGAWYRAFDFDKWEYWASDSDVGWGAWSIETGWTQAWISVTMAMRAENTSLWAVTQGSAPGATASALKEEIVGRARVFEFVTKDRRKQK
jgi:hypothetical protein